MTCKLDALEAHVKTKEFDEQCAAYSKRTSKGSPLSNDSSLWDNDDDSLSISSVESSPHEVSKLEAHLYYFGIRGPKLIFRNSKGVHVPLSGPEQNPRAVQLRPVNKHHTLGKDDLRGPFVLKFVTLICELTFVPRLLGSSTSEVSNIRLLILLVYPD